MLLLGGKLGLKRARCTQPHVMLLKPTGNGLREAGDRTPPASPPPVTYITHKQRRTKKGSRHRGGIAATLPQANRLATDPMARVILARFPRKIDCSHHV